MREEPGGDRRDAWPASTPSTAAAHAAAHGGAGRPLGGPVSLLVPVGEASEVGEARRTAVLLGERAGLDETARGHLALVATEAATNLARHARDGVLLLRTLVGASPTDPPAGVEVLAVDAGPGMGDLPRHLRDGFSTGGTAGHGLGAMGRLAHGFDVHSLPGVGTVLVARVVARAARAAAPLSALGVVCRPIDGETACGDAWAVHEADGRTTLLVADGLGHGPTAAEAAEAATGAFRRDPTAAPAEIVARCHAALRATRGAAVAVVSVEWATGAVRFAGVGNVAAALVAPEHGDRRGRSFASMNGIVGHAMRGTNEFRETWIPGALLVLHTDGLASRWRLDAYAGLTARDPSLAAATLWRDFARGRDDVTVVALRESRRADA